MARTLADMGDSGFLLSRDVQGWPRIAGYPDLNRQRREVLSYALGRRQIPQEGGPLVLDCGLSFPPFLLWQPKRQALAADSHPQGVFSQRA